MGIIRINWIKVILFLAIFLAEYHRTTAQDCSQDIIDAVNSCELNFNQEVRGAHTDLWAEDIDIYSQHGCTNALEEQYITAKKCVTDATEFCTHGGSDQLLLNMTEAYNNFILFCEGFCGPNGLTAGQACMSGVTSILLAPGIQQRLQNEYDEICQQIEASLQETRTCLANVSQTEYCITTDSSILGTWLQQLVVSYELYCDSCSVTSVYVCLPDLQVLSDFTGLLDIIESCPEILQILKSVDACIAQYTEGCDDPDPQWITISQSYTTGLAYMRDICDQYDERTCGSSSDLLQILEESTNCLIENSQITGGDSPDEICELADALIGCVEDSDMTCPVVSSQIMPSMQYSVQRIIDMLGCPVTYNKHIYAPPTHACDLIRMIECYNPLVDAFGGDRIPLAKMSRTTRISALELQMRLIATSDIFSDTADANDLQDVYSSTCSNNIRNLNWNSIYSCVIDQYAVCAEALQEIASSDPDSTEDTIEKVRHQLGDLFDVGDRMTRQLQLLCDTDCDTVGDDYQTFEECIGADALQSVILEILPSLNDMTADPNCTSIERIITCISDSGVINCGTIQVQQLWGIFGSPIYQQYLDLCGITDIKTPAQPGLCVHEVFRESELSVQNIDSCERYLDTMDHETTESEICHALQAELTCYAERIRCCEQRLSLLQPRLHRYAYYNQQMCDAVGVPIEMHVMTHSTGSVPVLSRGESCSYAGLLLCYTSLFDVVGVSLVSADTTLLQKLQQLTILHNPSKDLCNDLRNIDFETIAGCRNGVLDACPHSSTCVFRDPVNADIEPLDIIDLERIKRVRDSFCVAGCDNAQEYTSCQYANLQRVAGGITWTQLVGGDSTQLCRQVKNIAQCIEDNVKGCPLFVAQASEELHLQDPRYIRALSICGQNYFSAISSVELVDYDDGDDGDDDDDADSATQYPASYFTLLILIFSFLNWSFA